MPKDPVNNNLGLEEEEEEAASSIAPRLRHGSGIVNNDVFEYCMRADDTQVKAKLQYQNGTDYGFFFSLKQEQDAKWVERKTWLHFHCDKKGRLVDGDGAHFKEGPGKRAGQSMRSLDKTYAAALLSHLKSLNLTSDKWTNAKWPQNNINRPHD
jgi:hypothetical protein